MTHGHTLGLDPGHEGAAAWLEEDGRTLRGVWAWRRTEPAKGIYAWELQCVRRGELVAETREDSLHEVGWILAASMASSSTPWHLVLEGLFVPPEWDNGIIELAESTGQVMGPLLGGAASVSRPKASTWRPVVLRRGWGRTTEEAKRAARQAVADRGLEAGLGVLVDRSHACEAALMAVYGHVTRRSPAQQGLALGRTR